MTRLKFIIAIWLTVWLGSSCRTMNGISRMEGTPLPGIIDNFPDWHHELMADTLKVDLQERSSVRRDGMIWNPGNVRAPMPIFVPDERKNFYHLKIYQPKNNDGWYSPDYRGDFYRRHEAQPDSTLRYY